MSMKLRSKIIKKGGHEVKVQNIKNQADLYFAFGQRYGAAKIKLPSQPGKPVKISWLACL